MEGIEKYTLPVPPPEVVCDQEMALPCPAQSWFWTCCLLFLPTHLPPPLGLCFPTFSRFPSSGKEELPWLGSYQSPPPFLRVSLSVFWDSVVSTDFPSPSGIASDFLGHIWPVPGMAQDTKCPSPSQPRPVGRRSSPPLELAEKREPLVPLLQTPLSSFSPTKQLEAGNRDLLKLGF